MREPKEIRLQREADVWNLRRKGWTQERIAAELNITQGAVSKALKRVSAQVRADLMADVELVQTEQIAQLQHVAEEAFEAWERSKDSSKSLSKTTKPGRIGRGAHEETTMRVDDQYGDPRYLQTAMKALDDIRKITGANAPYELNLNWRAHAEKNGVNPGEVFEEMVQYLAASFTATDDSRGGARGEAAG